MDTKANILQTAIQIFNQKGYGASSLQDIANELGVGRRNIAYHFPSKEDLLKSIGEELWSTLAKERENRRDFPSFENLEREAQMYHQFQKDYAFIFQDQHVAKHPIMEERFRELCLETIKVNEAAIAFAVKLGNMRPEPFPGAYHNLALSVWIVAFSWMSRQSILNDGADEGPDKVIWSLTLSHFTEKGIESFKAFYGEDYYNSLGKPFNVAIDKFIF
ncbi:MAG: TetR/AcrR family transcriptional regulator [Bacteroidota bacterium]